jgi:Tfp pilus assembly protein PilF
MATPGQHSTTALSEAKAALGRKEFARAIEKATEVITADPKEAPAYLIRAESLRRLGKPELALADLAVAIRLQPDRPSAYVVRAEIHKKRCQFDQAIADATQAIFLDPENAAAYSIRATCRESIGDVEGAAVDHEELVRIDPTRPANPSMPSANTTSPASADRSHPSIPDDDRHVFADGKKPDRSYRSRPSISNDEAAEALGEASGYKPGILPKPLSSGRERKKEPVRGGYGVLLVAVLVIAACLVLIRGSASSDPAHGQGTTQAKSSLAKERGGDGGTDRLLIAGQDGKETETKAPGEKPALPKVGDQQATSPTSPPVSRPASIQVRQIRITLDEAGDCRLVVDTREQAIAVDPPQGRPATIAGFKSAEVSLRDDGLHEIVHSFDKIDTTADFGSLNGSPMPIDGISIDRTNGVLVMSPIPVDKGPTKKASFSYPRYLKAPMTATIDFEKFDNYTIFLTLKFSEGVLQFRVSPKHPGWQQDGSRLGATFSPIVNKKPGKESVMLEGRLEPDKLAEYGFHVPAEPSMFGEKCELNIHLQGHEPALIRRLDVRAKIAVSFGLSLDTDKLSTMSRLANLTIGKEVPVVVLRAGQQKTIVVKGE